MPDKTPQVSVRAIIKRNASRAEYDRGTIYEILDGQQICHVAYVEDGEPRLIPTLFMRRDDDIYLHGNRQAALLKHAGAGGLVVISVMALDGVVVARSGFHCSMNYRSVTLFGHGELVSGDEHLRVLDDFVNALIPGHGDAVRPPTTKELAATTAVRVRIEDAAAKIRTGPPIDDEDDIALDVWAGEIPITEQVLAPVASPDLKSGLEVPDYIHRYGKTP
jgi:hypothetical protein